MMIERRREYTSATTPVGTSNKKMASSMVVPTKTSCSGDRPATVASYSEVTTKAIEKRAEIPTSMSR
jgi:hypothetical protein